MFITGAGNEEVRMALLAAIGGNMHCMAEYGAAGTEIDLFDRMAFLTVGFHTKGGLAIVAGTACPPLFHISHAGSYALFTSLEDFIVALNTCEHALMNGMAEGCSAGLLDFENDIDGRFMTRVTISFYAENGRTIVATAA